MTGGEAARFQPDYAASPAEYLALILSRLGMTQSDLAARTGLSPKHINQIVKGVATISPETASQFEFATGERAEIWVALEARHQALKARTKSRERLAESLSWLDRFNLKELHKRGLIPGHAHSVETAEALLRYFGISDPDGWDRVWKPNLTSFRRSPSFTPDATATTVWLRAGQRAASHIKTAPYDPKALQAAVPDLRSLTTLNPSAALPELQTRMAGLGVAVVYVAEFDGCRASGATWWASPDKAVILLSNRGKREDRFWFSFFHEVGHVLLHAKRDTFLDQSHSAGSEEDSPPWADPAPTSALIDDGSRDSKVELEADSFAQRSLIPADVLPLIPQLSSEAAIVELAARIGVSPGVVAGRYQYETNDYRKYNPLRRQVPHQLFEVPV